MNDIAHFARFDEREALSRKRRGRVVARRVVDERFEFPQMLAQGIGAQTIAARRHLHFAAEAFYHIAATACDRRLQAVLTQAVNEVQGRSLSLPSGAGHDAIAIAERWPVGMLFVRCKGGVSHHPAESVMAEDVALAIEAFSRAVIQLADRVTPAPAYIARS